VGDQVAEAERERELSKQALAGHVSALETRVRGDLRRDALRYAVIGAAAVAVAVTVVVLRWRRRKADAPIAVASLEDVATQLEEIRRELARRRKENGPLWQRLAVRAATSAAAAGGAAVARRAMDRMAGDETPAGEEAGPVG
jgi:anti-sigma-K factor RskA